MADNIPVDNPKEEGFRAPTNRVGTLENMVYQFTDTFERPVFVEISPEL